MRRAYTLVELMITVAIVGILAAGPSMMARQGQLAGLAELQRERAGLLLEYHADCAASGRAVDAEVVRQLVEQLPDAAVQTQRGDGLVILTVHWRHPLGYAAQRSLTVFGGRP